MTQLNVNKCDLRTNRDNFYYKWRNFISTKNLVSVRVTWSVHNAILNNILSKYFADVFEATQICKKNQQHLKNRRKISINIFIKLKTICSKNLSFITKKPAMDVNNGIPNSNGSDFFLQLLRRRTGRQTKCQKHTHLATKFYKLLYLNFSASGVPENTGGNGWFLI